MALVVWGQKKGDSGMISFMKTRNLWFGLSGILIAASIVFFIIWGLKPGIDFTGGSLIELTFTEKLPEADEIREIIKKSVLIENMFVQTIGEKGIVVRFKDVDEQDHQKILAELKINYGEKFQEERFESIGPSIGKELKDKTIKAVFIAIIGIILYIAWAFRKVSKPVSSWKYGVIAAVAVFHDVIITAGIFSIFGKFFHMEINSPFIAAVLTILGYSVNDTIVVFDRIRENLYKFYQGNLETIIDKSINETYVRSFNTSFTVILTLFAILIFGGEGIRDFALALIIGISVGTYSSIFLASPLLLVVEKFGKKKS